jgi:hypothetical protein
MKNLNKIAVTLAFAASTAYALPAPPATTTETFLFAKDGQTFAELSVSGLGSAALAFSLKIDKDLTSLFGSNAYVSFLDFNAKPNSLTNPTVKTERAGGVSTVFVTSNDVAKPYDFQFSFGKHQDRLTSGESVSWDALFRRHVVIGQNGSTFGIEVSRANRNIGFFTASLAAVPEPETYAMMLAGLGMMGFMVRRRSARRS